MAWYPPHLDAMFKQNSPVSQNSQVSEAASKPPILQWQLGHSYLFCNFSPSEAQVFSNSHVCLFTVKNF